MHMQINGPNPLFSTRKLITLPSPSKKRPQPKGHIG